MKRLLAALAATAAMGAAGDAGAVVISFEGGTLTTSATQPNAAYVEDGFLVQWYGEAPVFIDDGGGGQAVKIRLVNDIIIQPVGGGTFSLASFRFLGGGDTAFYGYRGSDIVAGVGLCCLGGTINTAASDPDWADLTHIRWCGYCISGFNPDNAIDDLNLELHAAAAPEPGAWALMILGFGGAGAALRRRAALA